MAGPFGGVGVGAKKLVCPPSSKSREFLVGYPGVFARISRGAPKKFEKNKFVFNSLSPTRACHWQLRPSLHVRSECPSYV